MLEGISFPHFFTLDQKIVCTSINAFSAEEQKEYFVVTKRGHTTSQNICYSHDIAQLSG